MNRPASDDIALICYRSGLSPEDYISFPTRAPLPRWAAPAGTHQEPLDAGPAAPPAGVLPRSVAEPAGAVAQRAGLRALFAALSSGEGAEVPATTSLARPVIVLPAARGMGCTTIVSTLADAFREAGDRVLVLDDRNDGLLAAHFSGLLATGELGVPILTREGVTAVSPALGEDWVTDSMARHRLDYRWAFLDGVELGGAAVSPPMIADGTYLVPVCPDLRGARAAVALARQADALESELGRSLNLHFVLNQWDSSRGMQAEVRDQLSHRLGRRLAPVVISYAVEIEESLAEGSTVIRHAADSMAASEFRSLAGWMTSVGVKA